MTNWRPWTLHEVRAKIEAELVRFAPSERAVFELVRCEPVLLPRYPDLQVDDSVWLIGKEEERLVLLDTVEEDFCLGFLDGRFLADYELIGELAHAIRKLARPHVSLIGEQKDTQVLRGDDAPGFAPSSQGLVRDLSVILRGFDTYAWSDDNLFHSDDQSMTAHGVWASCSGWIRDHARELAIDDWRRLGVLIDSIFLEWSGAQVNAVCTCLIENLVDAPSAAPLRAFLGRSAAHYWDALEGT